MIEPSPSGSGDYQCAGCDNFVTDAGARVAIAGVREREVVNPGGRRFTIGCFASGRGCIASGEASDESTWFPGHTWQRVFCRQCSAHIGWLFRQRSAIFYGFILAASGGSAHPVLGRKSQTGHTAKCEH